MKILRWKSAARVNPVRLIAAILSASEPAAWLGPRRRQAEPGQRFVARELSGPPDATPRMMALIHGRWGGGSCGARVACRAGPGADTHGEDDVQR